MCVLPEAVGNSEATQKIHLRNHLVAVYKRLMLVREITAGVTSVARAYPCMEWDNGFNVFQHKIYTFLKNFAHSHTHTHTLKTQDS